MFQKKAELGSLELKHNAKLAYSFFNVLTIFYRSRVINWNLMGREQSWLRATSGMRRGIPENKERIVKVVTFLYIQHTAAYSDRAVQPILGSWESRMCSPRCKTVQYWKGL